MRTDQSDLTTFGGEVLEDAYDRYKRGGNAVPGQGWICDPCLDEFRAADRGSRRKPNHE